MMIALRHVRLIDGLGSVQERATVVVKDDRILSAGPSRSTTVPRGAVDLDVRGMTVLPGLIDCHVHLGLGGEPDVVTVVETDSPGMTLLKAARYAEQTIGAGITTVRDVGYKGHGIFALKQAIAAGLVLGPRVLAAGQAICMTGGHARFIGREADGPIEIVRAVREQLAAGADLIKIIASGGVLTPGTSPDQAQFCLEEIRAAVQEAQRAGKRVAAHAHGAAGMKQAVAAGVRSIEHATLMDEEAAEALVQHEVFIVPTLSALATTSGCPLGAGVPESVVTKARDMSARHEASFKKAHKRGVRIAMGTDAGTPFNYHGENAQELDRMVALGMSPMEAILSATASAAALLGLDDRIGTIQPGKLADLIIVEGNPLKRIALLRDRNRLAGVMLQGRLVSGPLAGEV